MPETLKKFHDMPAVRLFAADGPSSRPGSRLGRRRWTHPVWRSCEAISEPVWGHLDIGAAPDTCECMSATCFCPNDAALKEMVGRDSECVVQKKQQHITDKWL